MRYSIISSILQCALTALTTGATLPVEAVKVASPDPACTNGPKSRGCWKNGFSVATDFDQKFPVTGNLVQYDLELTNGTCNPDGHGERLCLLVNGQYPGPLLRAAWGDTMQVTVTNSMQDNGTSMHFHGLRQYKSTSEDGVNGVTQCPLAPGYTKTHTFQVTQYGTGWYHSHFSSQYGDGIFGPIVFDGPATANYDIDLGPYMLNEWYYMTTYQALAIATQNLQTPTSPAAAPPVADNVLINGTNQDANGRGKYNRVHMRQGKKYLLRLINSSVNQFFSVSLDNHTMQVIKADFVPVLPYYTNTLLINVGQRYGVVIEADQPPGNYWFRVRAAAACLNGNDRVGLAIWTYTGIQPLTPTSMPYSPEITCLEPTSLAPYWNQPVPSSSFTTAAQQLDVGITRQVIVPGGDAIFVWALGNSSFNIDWSNPTLSYLMNDNGLFPSTYNVLPTVSEGAWNYWIIQQGPNAAPIPHPIHLHGHDFFVLGQGAGTFNPSSAALDWATPVRRDTATIQANGWLALAFNSNNPGTWLMHCHIAFHASEGLAVQFLEAPSQIVIPNMTAYQETCDNWNAYAPTAYWKKDDSGV